MKIKLKNGLTVLALVAEYIHCFSSTARAAIQSNKRFFFFFFFF
jgi:hypothetical protein